MGARENENSNLTFMNMLAGLEKYRPTDRLSPTLAFAIRIFCEIATQEMILPRFIHIIDRYSGWKSVSNADEHSVYYDCEYEYIRIDPSDSLATNRLVRHTPMLRFLDQIDRLLKHRLTWKRKTSRRAWGHYRLPPDWLSVRNFVRVIARRDNEVVPKITRGTTTHPKMKKAASITSSHGKTVKGKPDVRWRWYFRWLWCLPSLCILGSRERALIRLR
ncbi:hypothetical protein F25303_4344 [Fusarium sp. NRRL 25303]|nr:hypothetical protein F25303_4344 [Fusarium sp. NRRL 25303]